MKAVAGLLAALVLVACSSAPDRTLPADPQAPVRYVALGDSTVEGVGASSPEQTYVARLHAQLRARYPRAEVENLGVAGARSADVLNGQLDRAIALAPDLVTLSIGPNDITAGIPVEQYERNVAAILDRLVAATRAVIVVNLLPDLALTPRFRNRPEQALVGRLTARFNEALQRLARERPVELVDLFGPSREELPRRPELVAADGYHPSDAGHARWAELMWQGIEVRITR